LEKLTEVLIFWMEILTTVILLIVVYKNGGPPFYTLACHKSCNCLYWKYSWNIYHQQM